MQAQKSSQQASEASQLQRERIREFRRKEFLNSNSYPLIS